MNNDHPFADLFGLIFFLALLTAIVRLAVWGRF